MILILEHNIIFHKYFVCIYISVYDAPARGRTHTHSHIRTRVRTLRTQRLDDINIGLNYMLCNLEGYMSRRTLS